MFFFPQGRDKKLNLKSQPQKHFQSLLPLVKFNVDSLPLVKSDVSPQMHIATELPGACVM